MNCIVDRIPEKMNRDKTALLLINVGTPDAPTVSAVRRYLFQFLNDRRVIDLPWLLQKFLVNVIIVPFRAPKSTKLYQRLWTNQGSPLLFHSENLQQKLQVALQGQSDVFLAMRYQNPSMELVLNQIRQGGYGSLVVLPMFPHYASSTSGTAIQAVLDRVKTWNAIPNIRVISQFFDHPAFIDAFAHKIESFGSEAYDHVVFSYHGLPNRHLDSVHPGVESAQCTCERVFPEHGRMCYKATCYQTTRLLVEKLGLKEGRFTTSFQSRLSKNWMTPFTDETLEKLALAGAKRVLIVAPSFVADCLETTVELGYEYKKLFIGRGGEELTLVPSLNSDDAWVQGLVQIRE
jgi:protoporphyrin/coproporphyrin ferrochelatase